MSFNRFYIFYFALIPVIHLTFKGRSFAVVSTEGVFTYALDVKQRFDPYQLETEVTPQEVRTLFNQHDYVRAVSMALRLNDSELIRSVIEELPYDQCLSFLRNNE